MNLDHLRYFEAIARLQHYGKAAELLHVSQPNLNYAVSQLESELGVPLFEKSGRNVRLTRYGQLFLRSVQGTLETLDNGVRTVQELGPEGGLVLVGSIRKLGTRVVPGLMRDFLAQETASVQFQLHSGSGFSANLLHSVDEGQLDLSFTSTPGDPARFETVPFRRSPFVVITPLEHPLAGRESVSLRETLPYPQIGFAAHCGLRPAVDQLFCQIDARPTVAYETEEDAVIAGMVAAGFGIAVLPDDLLFSSLPLAVLPLTEPDPTRTAYLSRKRGVQHPQAADRFFRFCKAALNSPTC